MPCTSDRERGIVRYTPNLGLENYPLAEELASAIGLPVFLENDVQAGVLGELVAGGLRGARNAVGVFLGTGIGGGIVIDGKIYRGSTGSAGEVGHMIDRLVTSERWRLILMFWQSCVVDTRQSPSIRYL